MIISFSLTSIFKVDHEQNATNKRIDTFVYALKSTINFDCFLP